MSPAPTKTNSSEPGGGWSCPETNPEAAINAAAASNIVLVSMRQSTSSTGRTVSSSVHVCHVTVTDMLGAGRRATGSRPGVLVLDMFVRVVVIAALLLAGNSIGAAAQVPSASQEPIADTPQPPGPPAPVLTPSRTSALFEATPLLLQGPQATPPEPEHTGFGALMRDTGSDLSLIHI